MMSLRSLMTDPSVGREGEYQDTDSIICLERHEVEETEIFIRSVIMDKVFRISFKGYLQLKLL